MICVIGACGYIGSQFLQTREDRKQIYCIDTGWFGNNTQRSVMSKDYSEIPTTFFDAFDTIVLFAGHSSVAMANNEPFLALDNNVISFTHLLLSLYNDTKFIYMSSSSVYNGLTEADEDTEIRPSTNIYDYSKYTIDKIALASGKRSYGLRLGTVCGSSPNFRPELMINKMYVDAVQNSQIDIYGAEILRPIADISDVCSAISAIIDNDIESGIYNVSSFNDTVGDIATRVGMFMEVPVYSKGDSNAYDFSMRNDKLQSTGYWNPSGNIESIVFDLELNQKEFGRAREFSGSQKMSLLSQ